MRAQDYSGTYTIQGAAGTVVLALEQDSLGRVAGRLSGSGMTYEMAGVVQGADLGGTVTAAGGTMGFAARREGATLYLQLFEYDAFGRPAYATAQTLVFARGEPSPAGPAPHDPQEAPRAGTVTINGGALTAAQVDELARTYGVQPRPGDYWYDARSGLYGVRGYPAFGFMLPDHAFDPLDPDVSNGNTGVFINGRHLPVLEWQAWSQLLGAPIQPGRYWLDAQGNAGYEGQPYPIVNLYVAAQQNAFRGGGDNFWTSRFGAGNYDAGNQRGYVSVPGYGPVGYGF